VGPLAATAADLAVLDAVCAGEDASAAAVAPPASLDGVGVALAADCHALAGPVHRRALDLAVEALERAGARAHAAGVAFKEAAPFDFAGTELSYREQGMDAYLAGHANCGVTTAQLLDQVNYPILKAFHTVAPPMDRTITGGTLTNVKALGAEELAAAEEKHAERLAAYTAQYAKVFEDAGVEVILTPALGGGPAPALTAEEYKAGGFRAGAPNFAMLKAGGAMAIYFNDIPVPSLSMPVPSAGEYGGDSGIPASVLLWGKPGADKQLIQVAMALEIALATM
jgi:Asp-tRNA(Asn)/Glu-tRNA(Gln) amidotransferase A subunit family amidase